MNRKKKNVNKAKQIKIIQRKIIINKSFSESEKVITELEYKIILTNKTLIIE